MPHHLVIRGGFIVDGTGAPGRSADLTHYDAQFTWDPSASCTTRHGVTTIAPRESRAAGTRYSPSPVSTMTDSSEPGVSGRETT